jgi:hypothetical protein
VLGSDVPGHVRIVGVDALASGEAVDPRLASFALDRSELDGFDPVHRIVRCETALAHPPPTWTRGTP